MGLNSGTSIDVSTKKAPGMSQEMIISSTFRSASDWLKNAVQLKKIIVTKKSG